MKILFVSPHMPGPPIFGGQRRIHGLMTHLAERHELSVIALTGAEEDTSVSVREAEGYCRHIVPVPQSQHRLQGANKRIAQLRSLVSRRSWEAYTHQTRAFQRALDAHLSEHTYDAIVCEFAFMAGYGFRIDRGRTCLVLDEHNIEFDLLRRSASNTRFERRAFLAVNWRKLKREEVGAWKRFDGCTLTSRRDEQLLRAEVPRLKTAVVPNGVDIESFKPLDVATNPFTLLFFGAMNYYPNTDAVMSFVERVLPLLQARFPELRLRIVGPLGGSPVQSLHGKQIEVVGFVDDLSSEIARAAVVIAPLRIGGGTRLKILEAMAMGKAIVSTSIGAEGIDVRHDHDILLADSPADQARAIGRVLTDQELRARLGSAARQTAVASYSWRAAARIFDAFLRELSHR